MKKSFGIFYKKAIKLYNISENDIHYIVFTNSIKNNAYNDKPGQTIDILKKNNKLKDIALASDISNVAVLSQIHTKNFIYVIRKKFKIKKLITHM